MSSGENVSASIEKNKLLNSLFLKPPVHNTETTVFFFFFSKLVFAYLPSVQRILLRYVY